MLYSSTVTAPPNTAVEIFCSYSHTPIDEELRVKFEKSLKTLIRKQVVQVWYDGRIMAGQHWGPDIDEHLNSADVIALLVSRDFLASDYCCDKEMSRALEREKQREAVVVPIIVRACDWSDTPLANLQAIPAKGRAVTSWPNEDEAWEDVAKSLKRVVHSVLSRKLETLKSLESKNKISPGPGIAAYDLRPEFLKRLDQGKRIAADLQAKIFALDAELPAGSSSAPKKSAKKAFADMDKYIRE
jgi:TIR domain-containing protein